MRAPTRVALYVVVGLVLAYAAMAVVARLDPCTDLDSDCDVDGVGRIVWAVLAVTVVMPVLVAVTETVARYRGWDVRPEAPRAPRPPHG